MSIFPFKKKVEVSRTREIDGRKFPVTERVEMDQLTVDLLMELGSLLNKINSELVRISNLLSRKENDGNS